jgi:hypothetical protein
MAETLKPFGIEPRQLWTESGNRRGYEYEDFKAAFERYVGAQK